MTSSAMRSIGALIFIALTAMAYFHAQPQIMAGHGMGWDGISYHALHAHFQGHLPEVLPEYPFCKRTGLPFLASLLPLPAASAFLSINIACGILCVLITHVMLANSYRTHVAVACTIPLLCGLFSPIRFPYFYPFTVDPPAMLSYAMAAWFISKEHRWAAIATLGVSCVFRESGAFFAILLASAWMIHAPADKKKHAAMLALAMLGLLVPRLISDDDCHGSMMRQITLSFKNNLINPLGIVKVIASISLTLAPFLIHSRSSSIRSFATDHGTNRIWFYSLMLSMLMSIFGGSDTTRIFFIAFPLYAMFLAKLTSEKSASVVATLTIAGLIANRSTSKIPEPTNYWPNHDISGFFSYFPDHAHVSIALAILIYWFIVARGISWVFELTKPSKDIPQKP